MLGTFKMSQVMTPRPVCIHPDERLSRARHLMDNCRIRHLPVVVDSEVVGLLSDRLLEQAVHYRYQDTLRVFDLMREHPYCLTPEAPVSEALRMMTAFKFEAIPIVFGRRTLNGIFTRHDAIRLIHNVTQQVESTQLKAA